VKKRRQAVAACATIGLFLAACGSDDGTTEPPTETVSETAVPATHDTAAPATEATAASPDTTEADTTAAGADDPVQALYDDCLASTAKVNLIALPDEWANYKGILASFGEKFPGVEYSVQNPNASSQEELDAVVNLAGQDDMPDALDVSPSKAQTATDEGLWQPYTPTSAADIPDDLIDADGNWVGSYYGIMSIGTNTTIVANPPSTWADLAKPEYEGQVALNGDPRTSGSAFASVMAASLANGGSADDIMPGIQFFADLKASGNLIPTEVTQATVISGETPIALDWSYNYPGLASAIEDAGFTVSVSFPSDGVYGGFYAQGVVKDSPNQECAKLWIEHILSDDGALGYLQGGAMPARYAAVDAAGLISDEDRANLPPAELLEQVSFLTAEQVADAEAAIQENWGPMVADA